MLICNFNTEANKSRHSKHGLNKLDFWRNKKVTFKGLKESKLIGIFHFPLLRLNKWRKGTLCDEEKGSPFKDNCADASQAWLALGLCR